MNIDSLILNRAELLLGENVMRHMEDVRVIIFGIGGVGSWCAESLVRTGIRHLTIVDADNVCVTNINRQLMATTETIGRPKTEALRERLLTILPSAQITVRQEIFCRENADTFHLEEYDYIIDAIDSLKDKVALIECATRTKARFFSSMGAALKLDPRRIQVAEFRNVKGCPLARALRQRFKKSGHWPSRKFLCVYSDELLSNAAPESSNVGISNSAPVSSNVGISNPAPVSSNVGTHHGASANTLPPTDTPTDLISPPSFHKAQINGSLMHITAIFGLTLAGLVIQHITDHPHT